MYKNFRKKTLDPRFQISSSGVSEMSWTGSVMLAQVLETPLTPLAHLPAVFQSTKSEIPGSAIPQRGVLQFCYWESTSGVNSRVSLISRVYLITRVSLIPREHCV